MAIGAPAAFSIALSLAIYLIAVDLGIIDSHLLLILVISLFNLPLAAWIMKGFFDEIPYAIEEAAQMDGASWSRPCMITCFLQSCRGWPPWPSLWLCSPGTSWCLPPFRPPMT
jgi:hypothetical protein